MLEKRNLASDNYAPVHPKVLEAIARVNTGAQPAYGADSETEKLQHTVQNLFGKRAAAFPVFNGTAANVVALQAALPRWGAVICVETAHLNLDEGGAPEKVAGIKLWYVPNIHGNGKLTKEIIEPELRDVGFVHRAQQAAISITNSTEYGTVYSADEIADLVKLAKSNKLVFHLDGARISNAAAALGKSFTSFTSDVGVDLVSLGGTKIGGLLAEAVVVTDAESEPGQRLAEQIPFLRKSGMQLGSKMRYLSAQLNALYESGLALELARHANSMAHLLYAELSNLADGKKLVVDLAPEANAVFPVLSSEVANQLREKWSFYDWDTKGRVRLMCSWNTQESEIKEFLSDLREALAN
jgi:threonine aldolase